MPSPATLENLLLSTLCQTHYKWLPPSEASSAEGPWMRIESMTEDDWITIGSSLVDRLHELGMLIHIPELRTLVSGHIANLEKLREIGAHYVCFDQTNYPILLKEIADPPACLYVMGAPLDTEEFHVAVIGSRKVRPESLRTAHSIGTYLTGNGYHVVSGGAYGCDISAHMGALDGQIPGFSPTSVVLPGGLGKWYPTRHNYLFRRILSSGGRLISERLVDQRCRPFDFRARNRIISGMAAETIVVEASDRSGALITASLALDQGRDVYVVPPDPLDIRAKGNRKLLADGAYLWGGRCEGIVYD